MPAWTWAAASRRGSAHAQRRERKQDAMRVFAPGGDFLVAIACDGAGSTSHGGEGAALAATTFYTAARTSLFETGALPSSEQVGLWAFLTLLRIVAAGVEQGLRASDFSTTLVMAISDGCSTLTAHVGDGAIIARDTGSGSWVPLSWPEHGEFAATTYFLADDMSRLRIETHDRPIDRLAVMTDGLERLALDFGSVEPHAPFFDAMSAPLVEAGKRGRNKMLSRQLAAFLDSEQVLARTDDDKTLILAALV